MCQTFPKMEREREREREGGGEREGGEREGGREMGEDGEGERERERREREREGGETGERERESPFYFAPNSCVNFIWRVGCGPISSGPGQEPIYCGFALFYHSENLSATRFPRA